MHFAEVHKHLKGIPYLGDDQASEIYQFVLREKPLKCLELGHAHGVSSVYIAAALEELGQNGHLDTVDLTSAEARTPNLETLLIETNLQKFVSIHREVNSYTWFLKKKIEEQSPNGHCEPCYNFCFIDGAKNWTIDGLSFFLADKLLKPSGWLLFDDYSWTYNKKLGRKEVTDGITIRELSDDERSQAHVEKIFQLLVTQHSSYSNFELQSKCWAWAQKISTGCKQLVNDRPIGQSHES